MRSKKKRKPGVQVKKYQFGGSVTGPMLMPSDATRVAMPDLQFQPVLQPLPTEQLPVGPTIGPATPIDEERYNRDMRRRDALARGINPNLAFTMPPGLQGDPQAAAEYQYDNMLTSPIGQIAGEFAFTPIGRGLDYVIPRIPSTYLGRQMGRGANYLGEQASTAGQKAMQFLSEYAMDQGGREAAQQFVGARSPAFGLVPTDVYRVGQEAVVDHIAMRQAMFETPEMQSRAAQRIADNLTSVYSAIKDDIANAGLGPVQMQEWNRLSGAVVNGKVDPSSPLVRTLLNRNTQNVRNLKVDVDALVSNKPTGMSAEDIYEVERNVRSLEKEIKELEEQIKYATSIEEKMSLDAAQQERKNELLSLEQSILGKGVQSPRTAEMSMGGGTPLIRVKGEFLDSPRRARDVAEHEFQHVTQEIPYEDLFPNLSATPLYRSKFRTTLPEYDVLEQQMLDELTMRKVSVPKTNTPRDKRMWDEAKEYYINPRDPAYPSRRERMPFLGEAKQQLVETGVIPSLESTVTKQDVLKFYDDLYAPEKLRRMGDQPIMDHPESLRFFELFDPHAGNNAEKMAEFMNRLSVIAIGAGTAGAAAGGTQDFKYGGKFKIKKKRKSGYRTI